MSIQWGSVAEWVSGLGTLAAVVTALYLSAAERRIRLEGYCGVRLLIGAGGPQQEFLFTSVTNLSHRTVTVNNIGMKVGRWRKRYAVISAVRDTLSDGVPFSLTDGQVGKWAIPLTNNDEWIRDLVKDFVLSEKDADTLRFIVYTTHRYEKTLKPEKALVDRIKAALAAKGA